MTLHQWQRLATPHLGGFLDPRPGVQIKGETPIELDQEVYRLSDYEEDGTCIDLESLFLPMGSGGLASTPRSVCRENQSCGHHQSEAGVTTGSSRCHRIVSGISAGINDACVAGLGLNDLAYQKGLVRKSDHRKDDDRQSVISVATATHNAEADSSEVKERQEELIDVMSRGDEPTTRGRHPLRGQGLNMTLQEDAQACIIS